MATLVVLAGRMIPTEEILKVSSRYLDWFRFYEFFFVKNPTNCPIIGLVPMLYVISFDVRGTLRLKYVKIANMHFYNTPPTPDLK